MMMIDGSKQTGQRRRRGLSLALLALGFTFFLPLAAVAQIGTPVVVGAVSNSTAGSTGVMYLTVPPGGVAVNNTLIVCVGLGTGGNGTVTVTDTGGNTYAQGASVTNSGGVKGELFWAPVTTALTAGNTITVTIASSPQFKGCSAFYVSGLASTFPIDVLASNTATSTGISVGPTVTTVQPNELLVGVFGVNAAATFSTGPGYTLLSSITNSSKAVSSEYEIVGAAGSYSASATLGSSQAWAGAIVGFKEAAGPVSASASTVVATPAAALANGTALVTITVTLCDAAGDVAPGKTVTLAQTSGGGSPVINTVSGTTSGSGQATFTVTSSTSGTNVFTATDATDSLVLANAASVVFGLPPAISTAPASQSVALGQLVNLNVSASQSPSSYQWLKDGVILAGQAGSTLAFSSFQFTNCGTYQVVLSNAFGITLSVPAALSVTNEALRIWGNNADGQLGNGKAVAFTNVPVLLTNGVVAEAAGANHSLFVRADGTLLAMGLNSDGQLGNGTAVASTNVPVYVTNNVAVTAGGANHSLFVKTDGSLWAMGWNNYGQLGNGTAVTTTNVPVFITNNVVAVSAGYQHSLFLKADGSLWAMGLNSSGQLGNGTAVTSTNVPVLVTSNVVAVAAGGYYSLFIKADGTLWAMGLNSGGQLGIGLTIASTNTPVLVTNNVAAAAAGFAEAKFIRTDGTLWAMGTNNAGQLGNGTSVAFTNVPVFITNNVAGAAAANGDLFVKGDGSLWAVGLNTAGELGNGTTVGLANVPVLVTGAGMMTATLARGATALHEMASWNPLQTLPLVSSENPAAVPTSIAFTVSVLTNGVAAANASGQVVFLTNGVPMCTNVLSGGSATSVATTLLPAGTNGVTAQYSGDANNSGEQSSLNQLETNPPPVAAVYTVTRTAGLDLRIFWANVMTNWSDALGNVVNLAGINLVTTNGVNLLTNNTQILYPNGPNVNDLISYTITDGHGMTNVGLINVVINPFVTGQQPVAPLTVTGGSVSLSFYGIPTFVYEVQRSTNLAAGLGWVNISTNTVGSPGQFTLTDQFPDLGGHFPVSAYYRLEWHP